MKKSLPLLSFFLLITLFCEAQFTRYIIRLKDKATSPFSLSNPSQFLTQRALDRRNRYNIAIDSTDLPVTPRYIDSIRLSGNVTILNSSKWLNQVAIRTTDAAALAKINSFPFVMGTTGIGSRMLPTDNPVNKQLDSSINGIHFPEDTNRPENVTGFYNYGSSNGQVKLHHGDFLHDHGFRGAGMQMTILDAGFLNYQTLPTFDSIRINNQVLGTWDFVVNELSVNEDNSHGMHCLSTIAANIPGTFVGTAPETSFYLYRTEDVGSEYPIEEQNFAAGVERSDSLGVDLCSVSLGYSYFDNALLNYTYTDMNGNTSISARAADHAAKKGMLLVIAAGNEGNNSWHYLITPSDADSVLCVGAVDTIGQVASFSSYGPSSDGQIKPAVAAVGRLAIVANSSTGLPAYSNGTSFACPNMAGITTCLWQAFPEVSNMGIIQVLQESANKYNNPDDRTGFGIPDAKKAFVFLQKRSFTKQVSISNCTAQLQFSVKTDNTMTLEIERKAGSSPVYTTVASLQNNSVWGQHDFSYDDDLSGIEMGIIKYRIKMIISTDTTFYLDSMSVNFDHVCNSVVTENSITIGPNPVSDDLIITISRITDVKINIVIQNILGQRIFSKEFIQAPGTRPQNIPMKALSRGAYFVTVYIDNKKAVTKKIMKD